MTELSLCGCSIVALPAAIGELKALTELGLYQFSFLTALPAAIGELKVLTELSLSGCERLTALPDAIGGLNALTALYMSECSNLTELPAAIGGLKALTTLDLSKCWSLTKLPATIGELKVLTGLSLNECERLTALPDAIGGLDALTSLNLIACSNLTDLPESIGGLDALETLDVRNCSKLTFPPQHMQGYLGDRSLERVKRLLSNTARFFDKGLLAKYVDDEAKGDFLESLIAHASFADRLEAAVRNDPALADIVNAKGQRAIDLACLECRQAMQRALFLLGRYDVDTTPPLHFSATAAVLGATDYDADPKQRRALKAMRDPSAVLAELKGRAGLDSKYVVAVMGVHVCENADGVDQIVEAAKLTSVVVDKNADLGGLSGVLAQWARDEVDDASRAEDDAAAKQRFADYKYLVVLELADETLNHALTHGGIAAEDFLEIRKIGRDLAEALDHLHANGRIHADVKPLNVVRVGTSWQLIDLDVSCAIGKGVGTKKPSSGYCPPEMARVLLDATRDGILVTSELKAYEADVAYDLWSLGVVLFHLATGRPLWLTDKNDDVSQDHLRKLAAWTQQIVEREIPPRHGPKHDQRPADGQGSYH